jgi:hypothetical protein
MWLSGCMRSNQVESKENTGASLRQLCDGKTVSHVANAHTVVECLPIIFLVISLSRNSFKNSPTSLPYYCVDPVFHKLD